MEATLRSGNNKYSTAQISTPKITKLLTTGVYADYGDCFIRVYNPSSSAVARLSVYDTTKLTGDIGIAFGANALEYINIPNGWTIEIIDSSLEITIQL